MVCRVATFNKKPAIDEETMQTFRAWMKEQPGFRSGYHVSSAETGKHVSISVWASMEEMMAMKDRTFPGGAMGLKPDTIEIFEQVEEF
jgi:hypothetical protein